MPLVHYTAKLKVVLSVSLLAKQLILDSEHDWNFKQLIRERFVIGNMVGMWRETKKAHQVPGEELATIVNARPHLHSKNHVSAYVALLCFCNRTT
jgi:hypothetical protein